MVLLPDRPWILVGLRVDASLLEVEVAPAWFRVGMGGRGGRRAEGYTLMAPSLRIVLEPLPTSIRLRRHWSSRWKARRASPVGVLSLKCRSASPARSDL